MSRATSRTNIKILALPLDADAQEEEAKKMEKKNAKKNADGKKRKNTSNTKIMIRRPQ
jgi:ATP-dependent DNA helicase PIF1